MLVRSIGYLSVWTVLLQVSACAQTSGAPLSLEALIDRAVGANLELRAIRQRLPEAQGLLRQAGAKPAPTLEVSGTTGRPLGTVGEEQYNATYNYIFETGGKRARRIDVAQTGLSVAQLEFDDRKRELSFELAGLYADAVAESNRLDRLDRLIALNQESIRLTEARIREGDAAPLERQLLAVDLNRAQATRTLAEGRRDALLLQIRQLIGMPANEPLQLDRSLPNPALPATDVLIAQALQQRPDLNLLRQLEKQGSAEVELAKAQGHPDLTVSGGYSRQYARFDEQLGLSERGLPVQLRDQDNLLTVGVQIPLGTRKRNRGNVEASQARAGAARLRREYLESRIPAEINAALRRYTAAQQSVALFNTEVLGQSEKNLEVLRQAYQLGQYRLLDVLAEQRRLVDTQLNYIDAQTELAKAVAELQRVAGGTLQ